MWWRSRPNIAPPTPQGDIPIFHQYIGEVVRRWAEMEDSLSMFAGMLLRVDDFRARIIMASLPTGRWRQDLIIRLAETYLDQSLLHRFRALMKRVKNLGHKRNQLAHSRMYIGPDGAESKLMDDIFSKARPKGLDFDFTPFPLKEVEDLAHALLLLRGEFIHFLSDCDGKIHTSARIHREQPSRPSQ